MHVHVDLGSNERTEAWHVQAGLQVGDRNFLSQESFKPIKLGRKYFLCISATCASRCTRTQNSMTLKTQNMVSFGQVERVLTSEHNTFCQHHAHFGKLSNVSQV